MDGIIFSQFTVALVTYTIPFGKMVGPSGKVAGIDLNEEAVVDAERRASEAGVSAWVHHRNADAAAIPYPEHSFDICHAERLFMHLSDPEPVLTEMIRVLKPGGRIVLVDADGATISVDFPDSELERRITPFWNKLHKNPFAGRQFFRLLKQHGMVNILIFVDVDYTHNYIAGRFAQKSDDVEAAALAAGVVTQAEIDLFHHELEELNTRGAFFGSYNMFTVVGQKP